MKYSLHFVAGFLAQLPRQIVGGRFADQRFAATRRAVEQKAFRRRVLKFREEFAVNQRQFDRVLDRLQRFVLSADFFPRQLRHDIEIMITRFRMRQRFERHAIIRIDPHFVARFERRFRQLGRALQDRRLHSVLAADAEAIVAQHFGDSCHRSAPFRSRDRPR